MHYRQQIRVTYNLLPRTQKNIFFFLRTLSPTRDLVLEGFMTEKKYPIVLLSAQVPLFNQTTHHHGKLEAREFSVADITHPPFT